MTETFGQLVRSAREAKKHTLRDVATVLGITASYLHDIEHDRRTPSDDVLIRLASLLDINADQLYGMAGKLDEATIRYIKQNRLAITLLRRIASAELNEQQLIYLNSVLDEIAEGR